MLKFIILILFISFIYSDGNDIVETTTVISNDYKIDRNSYCRKRTNEINLKWNEEFNKSNLLKSKWNYSTSNGFRYKGEYIPGWGNGELQYYMKPRNDNKNYTNDNLFIEDGLLKIQPIQEKYRGLSYTSARINTKSLMEFTYPSRITICFKVPTGVGFWPAFWLMPNDDSDWPQGGEIDILENRGRISNISSSALHFGKDYKNKSTLVGEVLIPKQVKFQDKFHSISMLWKKNSIAFVIDNEKTPSFSIDNANPEFIKYSYPFNRSYYMIINVAVGGKYDDYWIDKSAFCIDKDCSNKENPDDHRLLIDWIEYEKL